MPAWNRTPLTSKLGKTFIHFTLPVLTATQDPTAGAVFGATITTAAWRTKPSWSVIASNDRAVPPELEKAEAAAMKATSITVPSGHVPMLSHPKEVANIIEQAAAKAGSH